MFLLGLHTIESETHAYITRTKDANVKSNEAVVSEVATVLFLLHNNLRE